MQLLYFLYILPLAVSGQDLLETASAQDIFTVTRDTIFFDDFATVDEAISHNNYKIILFAQNFGKYGGVNKKWLCVYKGNRLVKRIVCPDQVLNQEVALYIRNGKVIIEGKFYTKQYELDLDRLQLRLLPGKSDVIYRDDLFCVYSVSFGEWGGKTWFKDLKTNREFIIDCVMPLITKLDGIYYLTTLNKVLRVKNPLDLTVADSSFRYDLYKKRGTRNYPKIPFKGIEVLYEIPSDLHSFWDQKVSFLKSFAVRQQIYHIVDSSDVFFICKIQNGKMLRVLELLHDVNSRKNSNGMFCQSSSSIFLFNPFSTLKEDTSTIVEIHENVLNYTFVISTAGWPQPVDSNRAFQIFENRIQMLHYKSLELTFSDVIECEKRLNSFTIPHKYISSLADNRDQNAINLSSNFLFFEDLECVNTFQCASSKQTNLVQSFLIEWYTLHNQNISGDSNSGETKMFNQKYLVLAQIISKYFGKPTLQIISSLEKSTLWNLPNNKSVELKYDAFDAVKIRCSYFETAK
jgi:hypothetical protein